MSAPLVGLSMMLGDNFRAAAAPLIEEGLVDALEWTPDIGWQNPMPDWAEAWLDRYSERGALYGHGLALSPLSGRFEPAHAEWLRRIAADASRRRYRHVSEHYGFVSAPGWASSAPFPVPRTDGALRVGRDRLRRLADAVGCPIGLENLATVFGLADVLEQGPFLERLLEPVAGFLVLDLHNLYCQLANFELDAPALLSTYPLCRVRELHLSGGSWTHPRADPRGRRFRRDTHDDAIPDEVYALLPLALDLCPRLELVVFERLGPTIREPADVASVQADYRRLHALVQELCRADRG